MTSKYILRFDKCIHICGWYGYVIGPFDTMEEASEYFKLALEAWKDQDALAGCMIEMLIPKEVVEH